MPHDGILPIAEIFESIQGEGQWVGTPMLFVRTAGCNVGKPSRALKEGPFPMLRSGKEAMACTTWDGRVFPCDTDYSLSAKMSVNKIALQAHQARLKHVCVTGGEPFLHEEQLEDLFYELGSRDITMHVETSGTILGKPVGFTGVILPGVWITCSPKLTALREMIERADELKILVDEDFDVYKLPPMVLNHPNVFLCPINGVEMKNSIDFYNVDKCLQVLKAFPQWKLSVQIHKFFGWR